MIENTSETRESLGRYTIPQLETMVEAISENNKSPEDKTTGKERLEDEDALRFLLNNQGRV
jgi:hypothetical protein